jgi:5'-deoxy-5'-methylthioadenosine phosphorylase
MNAPLGIIAGTGFYSLSPLENSEVKVIDTKYGSAQVTQGLWHGRLTYFLTRHGTKHSVPPHKVNYRANIQALFDLGVKEILAVNVCGGIDEKVPVGGFQVVNDFIDFTKNRTLTFFDGEEGVNHVDMNEPYDENLRKVLLQAGKNLNIEISNGGIYGGFEGPRFETKAEIQMAKQFGVTMVGMTGVPEVILAVEKGLKYAAICIVANPGAGLSEDIITMEDVQKVVSDSAKTVVRILDEATKILASK